MPRYNSVKSHGIGSVHGSRVSNKPYMNPRRVIQEEEDERLQRRPPEAQQALFADDTPSLNQQLSKHSNRNSRQ